MQPTNQYAPGRLSPEKASVTVVCGERRLPGVRREEVPQLAPVYYTGMKRVKLRGASTSVLRSLTRILRMDETETQHRSTR